MITINEENSQSSGIDIWSKIITRQRFIIKQNTIWKQWEKLILTEQII